MTRTKLYPVANGVWGADAPTKLRIGITFPNRMVVAQLSNGSAMLYSPVPIDDALAAEIEAVGRVELVVAPNLFHHLYVPVARAISQREVPARARLCQEAAGHRLGWVSR